MKVDRILAAALIAALPLAAVLTAAGDSRLIDAVKRRDANGTAELLRAGIDVNAATADGTTALHWAAHWDDVAAVRSLLKAGAKVNAATDLGVTPAALSCSSPNSTVVEALLGAGADPNLASSTGETPLMTCTRMGNVSAVAALLKAGANPNAKEDARGQTALMWAAARGQAPIVKLLVDRGAQVDARSAASPLVVSRTNRYGGVGGVNRGIADVGQGGSTALLLAARSGDVASARHLVAAGADVNAAGQDKVPALTVAAHSGNGAVAALLLEKGANPNAAGAGYTALHAAVLKGDLPTVQALLKAGANPNAALGSGSPARRYSQDYAFTEAWIGASPFWLAARFAEPAIMEALAAAGANTTGTIKDGTTALMTAAGLGSNGTLAGSLSISDRRERRIDPVELALLDAVDAERRALEGVKIALKHGGNVNATNQIGDTALHGAAANDYLSVISFLVENGAMVNVRNKRNQTPLAAADGKAAELLKQLGAVPAAGR
jgi:ankyrin repeat protein